MTFLRVPMHNPDPGLVDAVLSEDLVPLPLPAFDSYCGETVSEPKRNECECAWLIPMRQLCAGHRERPFWIEE